VFVLGTWCHHCNNRSRTVKSVHGNRASMHRLAQVITYRCCFPFSRHAHSLPRHKCGVYDSPWRTPYRGLQCREQKPSATHSHMCCLRWAGGHAVVSGTHFPAQVLEHCLDGQPPVPRVQDGQLAGSISPVFWFTQPMFTRETNLRPRGTAKSSELSPCTIQRQPRVRFRVSALRQKVRGRFLLADPRMCLELRPCRRLLGN